MLQIWFNFRSLCQAKLYLLAKCSNILPLCGLLLTPSPVHLLSNCFCKYTLDYCINRYIIAFIRRGTVDTQVACALRCPRLATRQLKSRLHFNFFSLERRSIRADLIMAFKIFEGEVDPSPFDFFLRPTRARLRGNTHRNTVEQFVAWCSGFKMLLSVGKPVFLLTICYLLYIPCGAAFTNTFFTIIAPR